MPKMNTNSIRIAVVATVAVLGFTLAGCTDEAPKGEDTARPTTTQTSDPTTAPTAEPTETSEPEVQVPANGEALTTQEQIDAAKAAGLTVYEMADGTKVAVDPAQDLPAPVAAEGVAQMQAQFLGESTDLYANYDTADKFGQATGKHVILIFSVYGSEDGVNWSYCWGTSPVYGMAIGGGARDTADEMVAAATAWVATQPNPETYQIIVVPTP